MSIIVLINIILYLIDFLNDYSTNLMATFLDIMVG